MCRCPQIRKRCLETVPRSNHQAKLGVFLRYGQLYARVVDKEMPTLAAPCRVRPAVSAKVERSHQPMAARRDAVPEREPTRCVSVWSFILRWLVYNPFLASPLRVILAVAMNILLVGREARLLLWQKLTWCGCVVAVGSTAAECRNLDRPGDWWH